MVRGCVLVAMMKAITTILALVFFDAMTLRNRSDRILFAIAKVFQNHAVHL